MKQSLKPPHKDDIDQMPPFEGLSHDQITVVTNEKDADTALNQLLKAGIVGFDTESKPTFRKGEISEGPHVLQFSTLTRAYIFQSHWVESHPTILQALQNPKLVKIGFGLSGDLRQIAHRFGIKPASTVDLDHSFKKLGYHQAIGAKSAVALILNQRFLKSKSVTISNWSAKILNERQLLYAANDAYAAIKIYHALQKQEAPEA